MRMLILPFSLLVLSSCAGSQKNAAKGAVELFTEDARVVNVRMDTAELSFPYELTNNSQTDATLTKVEYTVTITGEPPHTQTLTPSAVVAAGQSLASTLTVSVPLATSDEAFLARESGETSRFSQTATFTFADGTEYQAEWSGELFLPRRAKVSATAQAVRYENNFELHFAMGIKNPNAFVLPVDGLSYVISIDGVEVQRGVVAERQKLQPSSELVFDITRAVGREDLIDLAKKLLPQKSISYQVEATLSAAGQTQSTPLTGTIDFTK